MCSRWMWQRGATVPPPPQPDPRVLALIGHALDNGIYTPAVQIALVQCFEAVFGCTQWWRDMLDGDPHIAEIVRIANQRTLH